MSIKQIKVQTATNKLRLRRLQKQKEKVKDEIVKKKPISKGSKKHPIRTQIYTCECIRCLKSFEAKFMHAKYCSGYCRYKTQNDKQLVLFKKSNCVICDKEFSHVIKYKSSVCSRQCSGKYTWLIRNRKKEEAHDGAK